MGSTSFLEQPSVVRNAPIRRSILIVEDDQSLADVLGILLERQGFQIKKAGTGQMGMALARTGKPSLILLDLQLPDVDGLELCQQLVDDQRTSEIPVIILSGLERPDIVRRSRSAGCHYFVHKPYDPNALLALIEQAINASEE